MIYVLNGGAPEKLNLFLNRADVTLLDNNGDDSNTENFEELLVNHKFNKENDYILITSENQRYYLDEHKGLYEEYKDNIICLKSNNGTNLSDKSVITSIKGQERKQISGTIEELRKVNIEEVLGTNKYIVKPNNGSGSRGIKSTISMGIFNKTDKPLFDPSFKLTDKVIVEPILTQDEYASFTVPTVVKNNKILIIVPIISGDYYQGQARWKTIILDTIHFNHIYNIIDSIVKQLGIYDGIFEPEIMIKLKEDLSFDFSKWNIIDLNPRWSLDCSTCSNLINQSFGETFFNLVDIYLQNNTEWFTKLQWSHIFDTYILTDQYAKVTYNNFKYGKFKEFKI